MTISKSKLTEIVNTKMNSQDVNCVVIIACDKLKDTVCISIYMEFLYVYIVFLVDGQWGNWMPWEECSVTCDRGEKVRRRLCDSPRQQYGGQPCFGDSSEIMECNLRPCAGNFKGDYEKKGTISINSGSGAIILHGRQ